MLELLFHFEFYYFTCSDRVLVYIYIYSFGLFAFTGKLVISMGLSIQFVFNYEIIIKIWYALYSIMDFGQFRNSDNDLSSLELAIPAMDFKLTWKVGWLFYWCFSIYWLIFKIKIC